MATLLHQHTTGKAWILKVCISIQHIFWACFSKNRIAFHASSIHGTLELSGEGGLHSPLFITWTENSLYIFSTALKNSKEIHSLKMGWSMLSRFVILYQYKSYSGGFRVSEWSFTGLSALQYLVFYLYINTYFRYTFIHKYKQNQSQIPHQDALNFNQSLQSNWRLRIEKTSSVHSFSECAFTLI